MGRRRMRAGVLFGAAAFAAVLAFPLLVDDRFLLKVGTYVGINALVVAGLAVLFGYAGQVSLGHAAFVGLGAYTLANLTAVVGTPWPVAFVAAGVVAAVGGLLLAAPSLRLKGHYLAMATLGFGQIMQLVFVEARPLTGGVDGFTGIPLPELFGTTLREPAELYWLTWAVVLVAVVALRNVVTLRPGRGMRAVHGSVNGARAAGVPITALKMRAFVVSAGLAGLAGALYASVIGFVSPSVFGIAQSVEWLAMAVLGGMYSLAGPLIAAFLLTMVAYVDALVPGLERSVAETLQAWEPVAYGLAIILVILYAPRGIAGLLRGRRSDDTPPQSGSSSGAVRVRPAADKAGEQR